MDVATISMILAKQMKLPDNEIHDIGVSGLLHDIGKTMIPNEILNKPGRHQFFILSGFIVINSLQK